MANGVCVTRKYSNWCCQRGTLSKWHKFPWSLFSHFRAHQPLRFHRIHTYIVQCRNDFQWFKRRLDKVFIWKFIYSYLQSFSRFQFVSRDFHSCRAQFFSVSFYFCHSNNNGTGDFINTRENILFPFITYVDWTHTHRSNLTIKCNEIVV